MLRRRLLGSMVLTAALLGACGDDEGRPPPPGTDAGPRVDSGPRDGGLDTGLPDGSISDAEAHDGPVADGDTPTCGTPSVVDVVELATDIVPEGRVVAVSPGVDRFVVAWSQLRDGKEDIVARIIPSRGTPPSDVRITDDFAISRQPAVLDLAGNVLIAWFDNTDRGYEVYVQSRNGTDLSALGAPTRLTENDLRDDAPALLTLGSAVLSTWTQSDLASESTARARLLTTDGVSTAPAVDASLADDFPTRAQLARLGDGAVLAWVEPSAGTADVVVQRVDVDGSPSGTPQGLTTEHNASGGVDVTGGELGGALAFDVAVEGVRPEVRFRRVETTAAPSDTEQIVTMAPERGKDASIASFAGGYVVGYRVLEDDDLSEPQIRLAFLDAFGAVLGQLDLAPASVIGDRTTVRVASDGTILVAWADVDVDAGETAIRAVRLRCE